MTAIKPPRPDLLGPEIHTGSVWMLSGVLLAAWVIAHLLSRRFLRTRPLMAAGFAGRTVLGTAAVWTFWQAVARHLVLETSWPLAVSAGIGAFSIEVLIALYQLERRIVKPAAGRWLLALRLILTAAVLTVLVQPVFSRMETRRIDRNVVVLVDDSASMQIADRDMPVAEKLSLASFEGIEVMKQRPPLPRLLSEAPALGAELDRLAAAFKLPDNYSREETREFFDSRREAVDKLDAAAAAWRDALSQAMEESRPEQKELPDDIRRLRNDLKKRFLQDFRETMQDLRNGQARVDPRQIRAAAREASQQLAQGVELAGPYADAVDGAFYHALPEAARRKIDAAAALPRAALAQKILTRKTGEAPPLVDQIAAKYTLRYMRFGRQAAETPRVDGPEGDADFRSRTDLTGALSRIRESYPAENLAGVVVLSDFRHNGALPPDDAARSLGLQGSPVFPVLTGSSRGTRDAAVISLNSPQSIFLGDRVRVKADIKADGLRGRELSVKLLRDGAVLQEERVAVPDNQFRASLRLSHQPPEKGIYSYTVRIDPVEGEVFPNNNEWQFDVAVSDDRTNVLLIDDRPRWEFRYLRNLFDSRDKSVHLQYVLLHPDTLQGAAAAPDIPADASRKFGESEATRLPAGPEAWRKFDVIILGDVPPGAIGAETWKTIHDCVDQRGAMLVLIAGPSHMPHAFTGEEARSLIPVEYEPFTGEITQGPEAAFQLALTAAGRGSPLFVQSDSGVENARIWDGIPVMRWRHPVKGLRRGAEVLAWAREVPVDALGNPVPDNGGGAAVTGDPASALQRQRQLEERNALVVAAQTGLGKVAMLNFDQTWRFRYGVGDTIHHKFWGQLMRWGAGENLPAGTNFVRLGTGQLSYEPGQKVRVMARLMDESSRPVAGADAGIRVYRGSEVVLTRKLDWQPDSHGMYETTFESLTEPGVYRVELTGDKVEELLAKENVRTVEQKLTIAGAGNPVELGEVSVDPELAARVASLSGGRVTGPAETGGLPAQFGPATREVEERRETTLWDNWIVLVIAAGAATAEWILRRRGGLV